MTASDKNLERTSSQASNLSRKSSNHRTKSRKPSVVTPTSAKTLESFPSLSPDTSPGHKLPWATAIRTSFDENLPSTAYKTTTTTSKTSPSMVETLITSTPSFRGRSALFDDSPRNGFKDDQANDVLGSLHYASDEQIQRIVKDHGAVTLVRRLAQDVADRDAEISAFRRKVEERERELKRMLREVEVSNMDIEKRLRRLEGPEDFAAVKNTMVAQKEGGGIYGLGLKDPEGKNGIDAMMGEAMKDDVGISELNEGYLDELSKSDDKQATVKARSVLSKESDGKSLTSSIDSQGRPRSTIRGWKDYLWNGNTASRKTSGATSVSDYGEEYAETVKNRIPSGGSSKRKGLNEDLFSPPTRISTTQSETTSRKSSTSAASWTVKLFGGNTQAGRDPDGKDNKRGRSATPSGDSKISRKVSQPPDQVPPVPPIPQSAKAALMKVSGNETTLRPSKSMQPLKVGAGVASKVSAQKSPMPVSPANIDHASNLGPVEMDTIHPQDSKPPTLTRYNDNSSKSGDLLTDRFGFIYDQRRRKKQAEAPVTHKRGKSNASATVEMIGGVRQPLPSQDHDQRSVRSKPDSAGMRPDTPMSQEEKTDEKPVKRWQDYLKVATFPTELLSHTPTAQATPIDSTSESPRSALKRSTTADSNPSHPSVSLNPEPEVSQVTANNAEIIKTSLVPTTDELPAPTSEPEPVKLLLSQLTELHDSLQRDKTARWNHFLHRVNAERKKERETAATTDPRSKQAASTPEVTLTDGEMIGIAGLGNKGKVGRAKWKEFKGLVLSGIPVVYRAKTWAECSGASALRVPGYYDDLVADNSNDDHVIVAQIEMDIHRTLTDNVFFRHGPGVHKLNEVLLAYSRRNPEVGYCQGMNLITASLLLIMPTAEDAFWLLTSLIENILPRHYYDKSLLASRADQQVLRQYVTSILPKLSAHLDDLGIELEALTFQWFLSVFTDCLSAEALFRVWDVIFCLTDGSTFLFQVALALLKLNEQQLLQCDSPARVYGYIGNEVTDHAISIDGLIGASEGLKGVIVRSEVEERRWAAVEEAREREKNGRSRGGSGSTGTESRASLVLQEPRPFEG